MQKFIYDKVNDKETETTDFRNKLNRRGDSNKGVRFSNTMDRETVIPPIEEDRYRYRDTENRQLNTDDRQ